MQLVYSAIVGSTLHGLNTPESDEDVRQVWALSLKEALDPFGDASWDNFQCTYPNQDVERFEIRKFLKMLVSGNPTALEILWSDKCEILNPYFKQCKENKHIFLDSDLIKKAHIGAMRSYLDKAKHETEDKRFKKHCIAAFRTYLQGTKLLKDKDFNVAVPFAEQQALLKWKLSSDIIGLNEKTAWIEFLKGNLGTLHDLEPVEPFTADKDKIKEIYYRIVGL